jgi:hypothetical protein
VNQIVAAFDPETANRISERIMAGESVEDLIPRPADQPETRHAALAPTGVIDLPCGYLDMEAGLIREAEVRELNGFDEEALAKVSDTPAKLVQTLLERAVVRIGDKKPTKAMIGALLGGDVDALGLAIRKVTYGNLTPRFMCQVCREIIEIEIDLDQDIETTRLDSASDHHFMVQLKRGQAEVQLPDWEAHMAVAALGDATTAEITSVLLKHCVISVNDVPVIDTNTVRGLSAGDRKKITEAIVGKVAGPQLNDVRKACPACEGVNHMPLSVAAMFQE